MEKISCRYCGRKTSDVEWEFEDFQKEHPKAVVLSVDLGVNEVGYTLMIRYMEIK